MVDIDEIDPLEMTDDGDAHELRISVAATRGEPGSSVVIVTASVASVRATARSIAATRGEPGSSVVIVTASVDHRARFARAVAATRGEPRLIRR